MPKHAVILIHGIGREQRYEMAESFVQGLSLVRNLTSAVVFPKVQRGADAPVTHATRVEVQSPAQLTLDVFESYWAPLTKGRTTLNSLLSWLLLNTFIPGRMLRFPSAKNRFVICYAIAAVILVGIALGIIIYLLQSTAAQLAPDLAQRGLLGLLEDLGWGGILLTGLGVYLALQVFYRIGELYKDWRGPHPGGTRGNRGAIVDLLLLVIFLGGFLFLRARVHPALYDFALAYAIFRLVTLVLQAYFVDYVGDIQVYVTRDENSNRYAAHVAVLTQAVQILINVLRAEENYEQVVLLGHSLGSVVGLDAIRELATRVNSGQIQQSDFSRLAAFVTFGSPLEKTLFFFGRGAPRDSAGTARFKEHAQMALDVGQPGIEWFNAWYFKDIIADRLTSYGKVINWDLAPSEHGIPFFLRWTHMAHSDYLGDKEFMGKVAPIL